MAKERRKYTKEYKESAVAMTERDDRTVSQVAGELGIDASMPARWRTEARNAPAVFTLPSKVKQAASGR
jgi:transposase-like protein